MPRGFQKGNQHGKGWKAPNVSKTPNTETMKDIADTYLKRMEKGELEKPEQGVAAVVLSDRIRRLENTVKAYEAGKGVSE